MAAANLANTYAFAARAPHTDVGNALRSIHIRAPQALVTAIRTAPVGVWSSSVATTVATDWATDTWAATPVADPILGAGSAADLTGLVAANPSVLDNPSVSAAVVAALGYTAGGSAAAASEGSARARTRKTKNKGATATATVINQTGLTRNIVVPAALGETEDNGGAATPTAGDDCKFKTGASSDLPGSVKESDTDDESTPTSSVSGSGRRLIIRFGWTATLLVTAGFVTNL